MENKYFGFVYETTNLINGKKYIGKCEFKRKNDWTKYLGSGKILLEDIKKFGKENFKRKILFLALLEEELIEIEEYIIEISDAVLSEKYYNMKPAAVGGDVFSYHPNKEEYRKKLSKASSGKNNPQYGKPKTEKMINSVKDSNSKPIEVDGVKYQSAAEYGRKIGKGTTTVLYRLNSDNFPNYKRLDG